MVSAPKFLSIAEILERLGVRERFDILDFTPMDHIAHREFRDLPAPGTRNILDFDDARGHMSGRCVLSDSSAKLCAKRVVEGRTRRHLHEEYDSDIALPRLTDRDGLENFIEDFDL